MSTCLHHERFSFNIRDRFFEHWNYSCCDICEQVCTCRNCTQLPLQQYFLGLINTEDSDTACSDDTDVYVE